ncbi:MAG: O-antigen polymerase, partial [Candidatus Anstonellaceae archaeon]
MKKEIVLIFIFSVAVAFLSIFFASNGEQGFFIVTIIFFLFFFLIFLKFFIRGIDWFSPVIFIFLYLLFILFAFIITVKWFGKEKFYNDVIIYNLIGFLSFLFGMSIPIVKTRSISTLFHYKAYKIKNTFIDTKRAHFTMIVFFVLGIVSGITLIIKRGSPFIEGAYVRFAEKTEELPKLLFFFFLLLQISLVLFILNIFLEKKKISKIFLMSIGIPILFLYGSRAVLFPFLMAFPIFWHYFKKRFSLAKIIIFLFIFVLIFSMYNFYRMGFNQEWYKEYLRERNYHPQQLWFLAPFYFTIRIPFESFSIIIEKIPQEEDFWHGKMLLSPLLTLLPGKQRLGQYIVTERIIGSDPHLSGPTALSFIGPFYIDFGIIGIIAGMVISGALLQGFYIRMVKEQRGPWLIHMNQGVRGWISQRKDTERKKFYLIPLQEKVQLTLKS